MSAELPGHEFGAARVPGKTDRRQAHDRAVRFTRRWAVRNSWYRHPVVRLRHIVEDDALIVEILPLEPVADRVVDDMLCIEFDGTDCEAFPTALCLTGFTAHPDSSAARATRHLLGDTLCRAADEMVNGGLVEREVPLDESVRDSRVRTWRRLTGLAIGVEILPGELRAVLVGADGEVIEREHRPQPVMSPNAVAAGIATLADDIRRRRRPVISGAEVQLGVQIGGPVDAAAGVVHHFHKRDRAGRAWHAWDEAPLGEMLRQATGLRSHVINDMVGYATYERWFHPAPDERCRAVLLISQGVGAKLIINGNVATRMPMEIGNMILHENGAPCECGKRGCLEATAGTRALVDTVRALTGTPVADIDDAVELAEPEAEQLDAGIVDAFLAAGRDIARGIGIVQVMANPSSWAIYGPAALLTKGSRASDAFLQSLEDYPRWVSYDGYRNCRVDRRPLAGDEGAHGAALAALEHFGIASPGTSRRPSDGSA